MEIVCVMLTNALVTVTISDSQLDAILACIFDKTTSNGKADDILCMLRMILFQYTNT